MAETPTTTLAFPGGCPDCGRRSVQLPPPLPEFGDDFDWLARDYDGFRLFIMQELAARFPERLQWTPGDIEVVLVEVLAALLDQLSDMTDRIAAEATLETARRPASLNATICAARFAAKRAWPPAIPSGARPFPTPCTAKDSAKASGDSSTTPRGPSSGLAQPRS